MYESGEALEAGIISPYLSILDDRERQILSTIELPHRFSELDLCLILHSWVQHQYSFVASIPYLKNRRYVFLITKLDTHGFYKSFGKVLRNESTAISEIVIFAHNIGDIFAALWIDYASNLCSGEEQRYAFGFLRYRFHFAKVTQILDLVSNVLLRSGIQNASSRLQL